MNRPPAPLQRRIPLRLPEHDYSAPGGYFITTCAYERKTLFEGGIINAIAAVWREIPLRFPGVHLDAFVVMPNHVHGIIIVTGGVQQVDSMEDTVAQVRGRAVPEPPLRASGTPARGAKVPCVRENQGSVSVARERRRMLLPSVMAFIKTVSGKDINLLRGTPGTPVWQRGYHEHVVRSEGELVRIRQYIQDNPSRWDDDPENPNSTRRDSRRGGSGTVQRRVMPPDWSV